MAGGVVTGFGGQCIDLRGAVPPPDAPLDPRQSPHDANTGYDAERTTPLPAPEVQDAAPGWLPHGPADELVETRVLPVIEDASPEVHRQARGGSEGTAVLRAVMPSAATAVLRAVPAPSPAAEPSPAAAPSHASVPAPEAEVADAASTGAPSEPPVSTGWTVTVPLPPLAATLPLPSPDALASLAGTSDRPDTSVPASAATGATVGGGLRGRILAVEGGYGSGGRRPWARGGSGQPQVLSAMLAAVAPQTLLAAEAVDAVHLPAASDPQTVLAHLRAAARHPGPLLVHLGGQLVADKRGGGLHLTLRESKAATIRQEGVAWSAIVGELRTRPADWDTLVIADLSADPGAWPLLQGGGGPALLTEAIPLWAVIGPDVEQIGTFTRALIEALHGGRPGAGPLLTPEQLRGQVHSVLRPNALIFGSYGPERPVFRNTARQQAAQGVQAQALAAGSGAPSVATAVTAATAATAATVPLPRPAADRGPVSLLKPGVPPTVRSSRPVSLLKAAAVAESPADTPPPVDAPSPVDAPPAGAAPLDPPAAAPVDPPGDVPTAPPTAAPAAPPTDTPVAPPRTTARRSAGSSAPPTRARMTPPPNSPSPSRSRWWPSTVPSLHRC